MSVASRAYSTASKKVTHDVCSFRERPRSRHAVDREALVRLECFKVTGASRGKCMLSGVVMSESDAAKCGSCRGRVYSGSYTSPPPLFFWPILNHFPVSNVRFFSTYKCSALSDLYFVVNFGKFPARLFISQGPGKAKTAPYRAHGT